MSHRAEIGRRSEHLGENCALTPKVSTKRGILRTFALWFVLALYQRAGGKPPDASNFWGYGCASGVEWQRAGQKAALIAKSDCTKGNGAMAPFSMASAVPRAHDNSPTSYSCLSAADVAVVSLC